NGLHAMRTTNGTAAPSVRALGTLKAIALNALRAANPRVLRAPTAMTIAKSARTAVKLRTRIAPVSGTPVRILRKNILRPARRVTTSPGRALHVQSRAERKALRAGIGKNPLAKEVTALRANGHARSVLPAEIQSARAGVTAKTLTKRRLVGRPAEKSMQLLAGHSAATNLVKRLGARTVRSTPKRRAAVGKKRPLVGQKKRHVSQSHSRAMGVVEVLLTAAAADVVNPIR
ncbi:hypothetical protein K2X33_13410, partial [bacterium]|nr:hypothetical protein [bacterium]